MHRMIVAGLGGIALVSLAGCMPPVPDEIGPSNSEPTETEVSADDAPPADLATDESEWLEPAPSAGTIDVEPIGQPKVRVTRVEPVAAAAEAKPLRAASAATYVVPKGKTLYAISREHGVPVKALIVANDLVEPYHLAAGQTIVIPSSEIAVARDDRPVELNAASKQESPSDYVVAKAEEAKPRLVPKPVRRPNFDVARKVEPAVVKGGEAQAKAEPASAVVRSAGLPPLAGNGFLWPVKGPIVAKFGKLGGGKQSDGITIAVPVGTPVKAAENGVVVYAGSDLKAYGNLLLVRHADGWMTAYANNDRLKVTQGEVVKRGQVIAEAGATGNVKGPQTYFEIRHEGRPVDPIPRLAES